MRKWKQGLTSLLAVAMLGSVCPAALAAEAPENAVAAIREGTPAVNTPNLTTNQIATITVGSQVRIRAGATSFDGTPLAPVAYQTVYTVSSFDATTESAVYIARDGSVRARMNINDLYAAGTTTTYIPTAPSTTMSYDPTVALPEASNAYVEGQIPPQYYPTAQTNIPPRTPVADYNDQARGIVGNLVRQGSPVMVRPGAFSYGGVTIGERLSIDNYTTIYSLNRVAGNHAFLAYNGQEVLDVNIQDVIVATGFWGDMTSTSIIINNVDTGLNIPVYRLRAIAQDAGHFVRIRDIARVFDLAGAANNIPGTGATSFGNPRLNAEFEVGTVNGATNLVHGWEYTENASEDVSADGAPQSVRFPGTGWFTKKAETFVVDGSIYQADCAYVVDYFGNGWTYVRMEDLSVFLGVGVVYNDVFNTFSITTI